jgi:hypothetical protein
MKLMSDNEFGEIAHDFSESHWCTAPDPLADKMFNGLKDHRNLVIELSHRLHKLDELLRQASCPGVGGCDSGECAFCYDRTRELEALRTFYREYEL